MFINWHKVFTVFSVILLLVFLLCIPLLICANIYTNRVLSGFSGAQTTLALEQTSLIYESNGNIAAEIYDEINRLPVQLEDIPVHVQKAFVSIEDERFYSHHGIDLRAILRALTSYYTSGEITEGASTITQQTMKMLFLSPERTFSRKAKEAFLALDFETRYTKDEILELYLNQVYFGEGAYGIQSASKTYFNKDCSELSLEEGALLAALIQAPSVYDPFANPVDSVQRRNIVLGKMIQQGHIAKEQGLEAQKKILSLNWEETSSKCNSYFIDYVIDEATAIVGEGKLFKGGLKIHTTLEEEIQNKAEMVFQRPDLFPDQDIEAALALLESETGAIKALIGGREYQTRRGFNRATQLLRQPGSAFKPVTVYAPAFELNYRANSMISDTPFKVGGYEPQNSDGSYYGQISIRTAVQWSRNVAAVRLLNTIGIDRGYEMAQKMGFELTEEDRCLPLALGGLTKGVSPLQMAGAYAAFANGGVYIKPYTISYIEDMNGNTIYRHQEGIPVMMPSTADTMKDVLRSAVEGGTGYRAGVSGIEVAGKTGTTELPDTAIFSGLKGNKDAWFAGFSPRYTAAVWVGYDEKDMDRQHYLTSYGGNQPAEIFRLVMANVMGLNERPYLSGTAPPKKEEEKQKAAVDATAAEQQKSTEVKNENKEEKQENVVKPPQTGKETNTIKTDSKEQTEAKNDPVKPKSP
ncbi:MAG: PBP1A family penicillin-binding protein [Desulfotomaculaceae bacterium]